MNTPGAPPATQDREAGPDLTDFVERMGGSFESAGLTRLAGRMLGWLLVCDPPHQSSDQLATALQASSGGVSTTARQLIAYGFVERFGVPSDRRAFFRLRRHAFEASLAQSHYSMVELHRLAQEGLATLGNQSPTRLERLQEMHDLYGFLQQEFPALIERFHASRKDRGRR